MPGIQPTPEKASLAQPISNTPISQKQRRWLKGAAHALKPVVMIGQAGLTAGVLAELNDALDHHELLKVKISVGDRNQRDAIILPLVERSGATLVTRIGNMVVLYRGNPTKLSPLTLPPLTSPR